MKAKQMSRTGAVLRAIAYTTALPICLAIVAVVYAVITGPSG